MDFEPEVNKALQQFSDDLVAAHPEFGEVFSRLQRGEISDTEAMRVLMQMVNEKGLQASIESLAGTALKPLSPGESIVVLDPDLPPAIIQPSAGLPRLNPLVEAAIAERVQFDGDAPELRSGRLPQDVLPAVPVNTNARSLLAVGIQLEQAAAEVLEELRAEDSRFADLASKVLGETQNEATAIERAREVGLSVPTGVPGYEAGHVPALRTVGSPTGSALAALNFEERQKAAYMALSTTQGRRSALKVLEELILVGLASEGHRIPARDESLARDVPIYATWTCRLSGTPETQSNFNFIDVASKSLVRQLAEQLGRIQVQHPVLEVFAINTVDVRQVGWGARVVSQ